MKKMVLGLSLSLSALALIMSPAMAAASPPQGAPVLSVADQDFLASLAIVPAGIPAPELAAKRPAIGKKSACSATANCGGGVTIMCNGLSSCSAADRSCPSERGHVTCDGVTSQCSPACSGECPPDWCTGEDACAFQCNPCNYAYTCNATLCTSKCKCIFQGCPQ
ncbi:MAG TPA: hypothetical protein VGS07_11190 [Thermoanaerobaculia bacterium]|jgi:hypothetical protein|nr:hypothetical protein [Thermoanaerobaculia bacterium]